MSAGTLSTLQARLAPRNIGAIYVWILLIALFSVLSPDSFARTSTIKLVLNQYAVTGLIAIGLLLPLCAGLFDLSIGSVVGMSGLATAYTLAEVTANTAVAILVGLLVAAAAGLINAFVVLVMGVDSFIGTLATGSIFAALSTALSGDSTVTTNVEKLTNQIAVPEFLGLTPPVLLLIAAMLLVGFLLEKTVFGRRTYAIGFDMEAARLGGVRIRRVQTSTLMASALLSGVAGVAVTAQLGSASSSTGPGYLLPVFAAAFLGATQFRNGRFNPWGAVVAVLLVGTANVGLLTAGAPAWGPQIFNGALLILAVSLTSSKGLDVVGKVRRLFGGHAAGPAPG